uniref:Photosystem II protein I n=1 Tax=Heterorhabditis bacteriophora TaxID=37862 RepID=A0A1I7WCN5_HETBA
MTFHKIQTEQYKSGNLFEFLIFIPKR